MTLPTSPCAPGMCRDTGTTLTVIFGVLLDMWVIGLGFVEERGGQTSPTNVLMPCW